MLLSQSCISISNDEENILLTHNTYFGLFIEYLKIEFIFSSIILVSKCHFNFVNDNKNKIVIERLISSQIGRIFEMSKPFYQYYCNLNTNPYKIIPKFYTDFGFVEQKAFPVHHKKAITLCDQWKDEDNDIDWDTVEIISDEENEEFYNPFDNQYNAIQYTKIPFDFVLLWKLQKSQFVIFWLKYVMNQKHINCSFDLANVYLNEPAFYTDILDYKYKIVLVTAICNYATFCGGYPFFGFLIRGVCCWPLGEFKKIINFMLLNSSQVLVRSFLCYDLQKFCAVDNKEIACENYCYYLDQCIKHKSMNDRQLIQIRESPFKCHLYRSILDIILRENSNTKILKGILQVNKYHRLMFTRVGEIFRKYVNENDLLNIAARINFTNEPYQNVDPHQYHILFLECFGFSIPGKM